MIEFKRCEKSREFASFRDNVNTISIVKTGGRERNEKKIIIIGSDGGIVTFRYFMR